MANLTFSVKAKSENPTKTVAKARNFEIIIDEPTFLGGTDAGADPIEYLLAALSGVSMLSHTLLRKKLAFRLGAWKLT